MNSLETATFASGCFWCTEAIFLRLKGIENVQSGYCGGSVKNPTYEQVVTGTTGHAESIQVQYDPEVISYEELLEVFWKTHDPTTLNRQGHDVGTHYRSAIFFHSTEQQETAKELKSTLDQEQIWEDPIVTEITPIDVFYPAERYHEDYLGNNPDQPYCSFVIMPKVEKFKKIFADKVADQFS